MDRIEALRQKGKGYKNARELTAAISAGKGFAAEIRELAKIELGKTITGCGNCLADAYFEIIAKNKRMAKSKYTLKAGAVLNDPTGKFDTKKMLTRHNMSDELAEFHLRHNPEAYKYFEGLPSDWKQIVGQKPQGGKKDDTEL